MRLPLLSALFAVLLTVAINLTSSGFTAPAGAAPLSPHPLAVLPGLNDMFTGERPENIGVHEGQLTPCPASPNCVSSQVSDPEHTIAPIEYQGDRDTARDTLLKILPRVPNTEIVVQTDDYIWMESSSKLMGFVDDGEFYFPPDEKIIHLRSAARMGESDLGVNRRRLEQIRLAMQELGD